MTGHTPGPWAVSRLVGGEIGIYREGDGRRDLARVHLADTDAECEANARLIAAAPDMLRALERILVYADGDPVITSIAADTIAAATGDA